MHKDRSRGTFTMNQKIRLLPQWVQTIHLDSLNLHTGSTAEMEKKLRSSTKNFPGALSIHNSLVAESKGKRSTDLWFRNHFRT